MPVNCLEGVCGTCKVRLLAGRVDRGFFTDDALSSEEVAAGFVLACQATAETDIVVSTEALSGQLRSAQRKICVATVTGVARVAQATVQLTLRVDDGEAIDFLPGQYAKLKVPGSAEWRSYSFTNVPGEPELGFLIRVLPTGLMSTYLRSARIGDVMEVQGPYGVFFLRPHAASVVMVAGGTGLGPMLSMLRAMRAQRPADVPVTLLYGVNDMGELAHLNVLDEMKHALPGFDYRISVAKPGEEHMHYHGVVTNLLDMLDVATMAKADFHLCGPPSMIEAARNRLKAMDVGDDRISFEKFLPSKVSAT